MEVPIAMLDDAESDRVQSPDKNATLALQRALNGAGAWMTTNVRDLRKCDHPLLPAEIPANIRAKVAKILQDRRGTEKEPTEIPDTKAPWYQQLERHVAQLMQQLKGQPQQFHQMMLLAASEPSADCVTQSISARGFVDARSAYRRLRRTAITLGEEIFYAVRSFVRRSQANGVLPDEAQVVRLASLYKLELRRHVTISAVMDCIHQADRKDDKNCGQKTEFSIITKNHQQSFVLRRQSRSAGVSSKSESLVTSRAVSAPADAGRGIQSQQAAESGLSEKVKSVHAFKLQALERLLAKSWQPVRSTTMKLLQAAQAPASPVKLSEETLKLIQERVVTFLYDRKRENYPLWADPLLSREETAQHLRLFVATLLATPLLQGLTIDQLLEVARASKWQILARGDTLCTRSTEMDSLIIVLEGALTAVTTGDSTPGSESPFTGGNITISSPICLGELGMVRNSERWPRTLTPQSPEGVKALVLSKLAFETLLHRFFGGKVLPGALAAVTNVVQPRRPSSSPAVIAKRLARSFRHSFSTRRPATAAPTAAAEANVARWHEVRDEKLRDFRAGLEAEERAAALAALQSAMEELSSLSLEQEQGGDEEYFQGKGTSTKPRFELPWSRHHFYPHFDPASGVDSKENNIPEHDAVHKLPESLSENDSPQVEAATGTTADTAEQIREYYKQLNARRSIMKARLVYSAPSDQLASEASPRKQSEIDIIKAPEATEWWLDDDVEDDHSGDEARTPTDRNPESLPALSSPFRGRLRSASFTSQVNTLSAPSSQSKTVPVLNATPATPLASPTRGLLAENNKPEIVDEIVRVLEPPKKEEIVIPETSKSEGESNGEPSPPVSSTNQTDHIRSTSLTHARKSALNIMLTSQSSVTMARHSKLLDKETAQHVLIQKHFADTPIRNKSITACAAHGSHIKQHGTLVPADSQKSHSNAPIPLRVDLQRRMDSVLNELRLPPKDKLDLVLKYTHVGHYDQFALAVQLWEKVRNAIIVRESFMKTLWEFELLASDPRRHFRSISTHRLREEKERDALFSKLNRASDACTAAMDELSQSCGDTISLGGRDYREKMKKDYTELLYEVEQERLRIIYNGVRPHIAPAADEDDEDEGGAERARIDVRVPSIPLTFAPHRPFSKKIAHPPLKSNQEENSQPPTFAVDGVSADPTSSRYHLATPRESIYVPANDLDTNQDNSTAPSEAEKNPRGTSIMTVKVQQQRQAELAALNTQLQEQRAKRPKPPRKALDKHSLRPAEKAFVSTDRNARKSLVRSKEIEERASLRELFQQFITRSKT